MRMSPEHDREVIADQMRADFRFFKNLELKEVMAFLDFCENKRISAGGILWQEGDSDNYAAFILSGRIGIKKKTEFAGKYMIVGTFEKGTVIGELCLLSDKARSVTAIVIEDTDIVILSSRDFETLLAQHPMLGLKLLKHIFLLTTKRLNTSYERIASIF